MFDIILEDAKVVDGSGKEPYRADIGITGTYIEKIGDLKESEAKSRVKAGGRVVCPGFIDVHSHAEISLLNDDHAELLQPLVRQGITTFVGGNCGVSLSPITDENLEGFKIYLEAYTMMDFEATIHWRGMGEFMDLMDERGLLLNTALLAPHGMLRISAMSFEARSANDGEIGAMKRLLEESLEAGAFGLSTGLQYPPGLHSDTRELVELAEPLSRYGGIFTSHLRSYTGSGLGKGIDEVAEVARANGIPGQVSHIFSLPWLGPLQRPGLKVLKWLTRHPDFSVKAVPDILLKMEMNRILGRLERLRESGVDIGMDAMPALVGLTHLLIFLPPWVITDSKEEVLAKVRDRGLRDEMLRDINKGKPVWPRPGKVDWTFNIAKMLGWDAVSIMAVDTEKNKHLEGRRLTEIAEEQGKHPFDVLCDLIIEEDGKALAFWSLSEPDDVFTEHYIFPALEDPQTMITTDTLLMGFGKPHYLFYGCYPKFIGRYVNEKKLVELPEAIRRCTSLPAEVFGIEKRGLVKESYYADLLVMDAENFLTHANFHDPEQFPEGLDMVLINGTPVVESGEVVPGVLAGQMLRK